MRHQLPGARRRKPTRGLLKPQHRMVLGLVALSSASLMLSLMYRNDEPGRARVPKGASTRARPRASVPLPSGGAPEAVVEASDNAIQAAVTSVVPAVQGCMDAAGPELTRWDGLQTSIEVQLGTSGLVRADVLDMKGAPVAFVGCLGAALSTTSWPSGGDDILLVRVPLTISLPPTVVPLGGAAAPKPSP